MTATIEAIVAEAQQRRTVHGLSSGQWPEPDMRVLSPRQLPIPAFPLRHLGGWAEWVKAHAELAAAPVDYVALSLLAGVGASVANLRWTSPWDGWCEPPILYVGLVGLPSAGKSAALDMISGPLREAERRLGTDFAERHRAWAVRLEVTKTRHEEWKRSLRAALKNHEEPPELPRDAVAPPEPQRPRILTTDATIEEVVRLLANHPAGLLMLRDELAGLIGSFDKYGGSGAERAFWIEAYGGRPKIVDRVKFSGKELRVPNLSIGIIGGIQPDRLATLLLSGDDDGLAARFVFVWPDPVPLSRPTAKSDPDRLVEALLRLRALQPRRCEGGVTSPVAVPFSEPARELLHDFRIRVRDLEMSVGGLLLSHVGKWPGLATRIALILELLDWAAGNQPAASGPQEVSASAVAASVDLVWSYIRPMARHVYGEAALPKEERDATTLARHIIRRIMESGHLTHVNVRDLQRARLPGIRTSDDVKAALDELREAGWVQQAPQPASGKGGRPPGDWVLNPKLAITP